MLPPGYLKALPDAVIELIQEMEDAVLSILDAKEDSDLDSLFSAGGTSALLSQVSGLDDFELICFLVVREEPSC